MTVDTILKNKSINSLNLNIDILFSILPKEMYYKLFDLGIVYQLGIADKKKYILFFKNDIPVLDISMEQYLNDLCIRSIAYV